jgi:PAS domain S-box-containing protein
VIIVVVFSGAVAGFFASQTLAIEINGIVGDRLLGVARMVADRDDVRQAFSLDHPENELQPLAETWRDQSKVDLIVIFDMKGTLFSSPNRSSVGQRFSGGDEWLALHGEEYISQALDTSGASLRAFVPVYDDQHRQVGVVVVGMWMWHVSSQVQDMLIDAGAVSLLGLIVGVLGAVLVAYSIKASIFGLEPAQIREILEERVAILQSIREGVIAVDKSSRVTMVNKEAERLTGVGQDAVGEPVSKVLPNTLLPEVVAAGRRDYDQEQMLMGHVIITNRVPIVVEGKTVGAVATFRDMSEIRELATELTGVKQLAETLRAQAHEFVNRLHTVSGLIQLGRHEEALKYISSVTSDHEQIVGFVTRRIHDPSLAGLMLGKISAANERGITLSLDPDSYVPIRDAGLSRIDLVTVVGNLIENAFDAVSPLPEESRNVWVSLYNSEKEMLIEVEDTGVGIEDPNQPYLFERGYTTKAGSKGIGLSLVIAEVNRVEGNIQVESEPGEGTRFTVHLPRASSRGKA